MKCNKSCVFPFNLLAVTFRNLLCVRVPQASFLFFSYHRNRNALQFIRINATTGDELKGMKSIYAFAFILIYIYIRAHCVVYGICGVLLVSANGVFIYIESRILERAGEIDCFHLWKTKYREMLLGLQLCESIQSRTLRNYERVRRILV